MDKVGIVPHKTAMIDGAERGAGKAVMVSAETAAIVTGRGMARAATEAELVAAGLQAARTVGPIEQAHADQVEE